MSFGIGNESVTYNADIHSRQKIFQHVEFYTIVRTLRDVATVVKLVDRINSHLFTNLESQLMHYERDVDQSNPYFELSLTIERSLSDLLATYIANDLYKR